MTKYCTLIGRKDDGGKDDLPGVGFFWESLDVEKYDKEAFSFLVTPPENAYEKNPRGGVVLSTKVPKVHTVPLSG